LGLAPIPLPAGASTSDGNSINSSGVAVGYSDAGGWIWDATGGTQLLSSLVPAGWTITSGYSISNNGFILAQGSFDNGPSEYVELTSQTQSGPSGGVAPEPSTFALLGEAGCGC
jgi:hypothetical protein